MAKKGKRPGKDYTGNSKKKEGKQDEFAETLKQSSQRFKGRNK